MERRVEHFEPWNPMEPEVAAPWLWSRERGREGGWSRSDSERSAHKNLGANLGANRHSRQRGLQRGGGSLRAVAAETPRGALADYSVQLTFHGSMHGRWVWDISSQESKRLCIRSASSTPNTPTLPFKFPTAIQWVPLGRVLVQLTNLFVQVRNARPTKNAL